MPIAQLRPNDRYAFVGKTRSGKTSLAMVLAGTFAMQLLYTQWEVWWVDSKNDPKDIAALRKWGFRNAASPADRDPEKTGGYPNAIYWKVESKDKQDNDIDTVDQIQQICSEAYRRGHVLLVIDEYVQAVPSSRTAGTALLNVFQRGGGKNVGLIGLTQEPVFIPRQLISQATHIVLFSLSYEADKKYVRNILKVYESPQEHSEPYGFYWGWVDGGHEFTYYQNQKEFYDQLHVAHPVQPNA